MRKWFAVPVDVKARNISITQEQPSRLKIYFQVYAFFCVSKEAVTRFLYALNIYSNFSAHKKNKRLTAMAKKCIIQTARPNTFLILASHPLCLFLEPI